MATAPIAQETPAISALTPSAAMQTVGQLDHKDRQEILKQSAEDAFERLAEQLNQGHTEDFYAILSFYRSFHSYSFLNTLLIMFQKPEATIAASFRHWKKIGRKVRPGSKAAWIWVPTFRKEKDPDTGIEREVLTGFRDGGVFGDCDIEDIDTNPLPSMWKTLPDDRGELLAGFVERIRASGIEVRFQHLGPKMGGYATAGGKMIVVNQDWTSRNAIMTLSHELCHCLLHFDENTPVPAHEIEADAEACSFVIAGILGIDHRNSADYLLTKKVTAESLKASLNRVQRATRIIIRMLDIAV